MQVPVHNVSGQVVDQIEVSEYVFGMPFNRAVVHQAMVRQLANARSGTAATKTRAQVAGSTRKLFRQKHTGRARQGSIRAPHRRGGGVAFGPHPRSYRQAMPKKMRRLALRCTLSAKVAGDELMVLDELSPERAKTREMARMLETLGVKSSALIVTADAEANVVRSARNIQGIKTLPAALLNIADLLSHKALIMTVAAVRKAEQLWGAQQIAAPEERRGYSG